MQSVEIKDKLGKEHKIHVLMKMQECTSSPNKNGSPKTRSILRRAYALQKRLRGWAEPVTLDTPYSESL